MAPRIKQGVIPWYKEYGRHMCRGLPQTHGNVRSPRLSFRNHITAMLRPHALWEGHELIACCGALVSFGVCPVLSRGDENNSSGDILVGRLSWEVTYKNGYSCTGTAGPRSSQGIPIRQIDCFLSSPPLIHVFHLSSNEPSAVWHHSGHLCIGPCTVHG